MTRLNTPGDYVPPITDRRSIQPGAGLSDNIGRQGRLADDLVKQFGLDDPGVGMALLHIAQMRTWGVKITPEVAKACIGWYVERERRYAEITAKLQADRRPRSGKPLPWAGRPMPSKPALPPDRISLVYYVQIGDRVKIGFTTNLSERMSTLVPERLLAVERGDPKLEQARHRQFAALRTRGEWFRYEPPLTEHVAALMDEHRPGDLLDTATAAVAFGVQAATIRKWVQRGKLQPVSHGKNNRSLYRRGDLEVLHSALLDGGHR